MILVGRGAVLGALAAGSALALGTAVVRSTSLVALWAPAVLGVLALVALVNAASRWARADEATRNTLMRWTIASLILHLVVGLAISNSGAATRYLGGDAITYHNGAQEILAHWQHGLELPLLPGGKEGYYYVLAGLYWVLGPYTAAGIALNSALAAALVPIVSDTTRRLFGPEVARYTAPVVVLVPGMILWTAQLLKEAPILFLLAVAANCGARLLERVTPGPLLVLMLSLPALLSLRGPVGFAMAAGIVAAIALGRRHMATGLTLGLLVAGLVSLGLAVGLGTSGYRVAVNTDLVQADAIRRGLAVSADSGFGRTADISTAEGAISYLPQGVAGFALGPFPWEIRGTRQLIAVPDLLAWYALLPALWRGQRAARQRIGRRMLVLALPAAGIALVLSLVIGNYGTIIRERMQILVLLAPVMAMGLAIGRRADEHAPEAEPQLVH